MPYLGNELATQFQAFVTQTITGDGSTGYTLDRAVANGKELLVYINNVKQEEGSGKSYTATGTTITFSEAVASGDSCYLVYMGSAQQTVTPPAGSLGGYTGNASLDGAVTINESSADVDFRVESDANAHALFLEGSTGNLGIGVEPTTSYGVVTQIHDTGTSGANLRLTDSTSGSGTGNGFEAIQIGVNNYLINRENGFISIYTNGSERVKIDSNGHLILKKNLALDTSTSEGIDFGAAGSSANTLDDYEEGTFTATMANSVTLNSSYDTLAYTKIGRQVTVTGQIQINNDNSNSHTVISNLPFTHFTQSPNEDADRAFCAVRLYNHNAADDAQFVGAFTAENTTNLYFVNVRDNASSTDLEADASGYLMFTITYFST